MEDDQTFDYATGGVGREQHNGAMHHYDYTIKTQEGPGIMKAMKTTTRLL